MCGDFHDSAIPQGATAGSAMPLIWCELWRLGRRERVVNERREGTEGTEKPCRGVDFSSDSALRRQARRERAYGDAMRWRIKDLSGNNLFNLQQPLPDGGGSESVSERSAELFRNES